MAAIQCQVSFPSCLALESDALKKKRDRVFNDQQALRWRVLIFDGERVLIFFK